MCSAPGTAGSTEYGEQKGAEGRVEKNSVSVCGDPRCDMVDKC